MRNFLQTLFFFTLVTQILYPQWTSLSSEFTSSITNKLLFSVAEDTLGPELIFNGDMELNTYWNAAWYPDSSLQSTDIAHGGTHSWKTVTPEGSGTASSFTPPQLEVIEDSTYWVEAYLYIVTGSVKVDVFTDVYHTLWSSSTTGEWLHISFSFVAADLDEPGLAYIYFLGDSSSTSTFYIDDVSVKQRISATFQNIDVLTPNGGESWFVGSTQNITWNSTNVVELKIEFSTNNGISWTTLATSTPAAPGSYSWTIPNTSSGNCKIKISDVENSSIIDESDSLFVIYLMQFEVYSNWNIVSVPILVENMTKSFLFPDAISQAFGYNGGYVVCDTLKNGSGYWLKFDSVETIALQGTQVESNIVNVVNGWNMIGPFDFNVKVSNISSTPPNIIVSNFFGFNNGYQIADTLKIGKGYWVLVNQNGILLLNNLIYAKSNTALSEQALIDINFTITDGEGGTQLLIAGIDLSATSGLDPLLGEYEIPPLPPAGVFDARFNLPNSTISTVIDYREGTLAGGFEREHLMQFQVGTGSTIIINYDFGIYDSSVVKGRLQDIVTGTLIDTIIFSNGSYTIQDPTAFNKLKLTLMYEEQVPTNVEFDLPIMFELNQNYPNPFNPSTKIKFTIPSVIATPLERGKQSQLVTLKVYDVLGNEIATLVDEEKEPGIYEVEFSPANLASGIYIYRMHSSEFTDTKKMVLLR